MLYRTRNLDPDVLLRIGLVALILASASSYFLRDATRLPDFLRGFVIGLFYGIAIGALLWSMTLRIRGMRGGAGCAR